MNDRENRERKRGTGKNGWVGLAVIAVAFLINLLESNEIHAVGLFAVLIVVTAAVIFAVFFVMGLKKASGTKKTAGSPTAAKVGDTRRAEIRHETRTGTPQRPVYTPSAGYEENATAANFERDRQRRLNQLQDFLKNGIIDKDEYQVLLSRYEKMR